MWAAKQVDRRDWASLVRDARDHALLDGLVLRYDDISNDNCVGHIPFTLFPTPFPKKLYQECVDIQPIVNSLMFKVALDSEFIDQSLYSISKVDQFTRNLMNVNDIVRREGLAQPIISCINRADYMLGMKLDSSKEVQLRQVEVNAIASAMSAHSMKARSLQEFLMSKYNIKLQHNVQTPQNNSLDIVAEGLIGAYDAYNKSSSYILLVSEKRSMNFSDQRMIEKQIYSRRPDIKFMRQDFHRLGNLCKLGPNKELLIENDREVAVVYFRYCYDPSNYDFEGAWDIRLLIERSRAIKCPSINFHLSGTKKFQQVLNTPDQLARYLAPREAKRLSKVFCKFWSLDSSDEGYKIAMDETVPLVLKPQREGGGHNIFGGAVKPFLERIANTSDRSQYILMEHIEAPRDDNWLLLHTDDSKSDYSRLETSDHLVSELGIFGSILADSTAANIISNKSAGYLVRSKKYGVNEGGVASGYAGIGNLILVDELI